jgi:hypothetical protein
MAMMAASTVEMNLEIAQRTAALRLPASLVPSILMTAMQDFVDQAGPADPGDRDALLQYGRAISGDLVDDYVAATATLTGPLVGDGVADASEP